MPSSLPYEVHSLYYDGAPQQSSSSSTFPSVNPSTGEPTLSLTQSSPADIDHAISSAARAFPSWSQTSASERARILLKAVEILRRENDALATVETIDTGKPFSETSAVDVVTGADTLEYYAHLVAGGGLNGETVQLRESAWVYTRKEALGVCAGIGAWNYPIQMYVLSSSNQEKALQSFPLVNDCEANARPMQRPVEVSPMPRSR